ncbi:RNA-binding protein 43 [Petaurus breviceps papuanus]|uniref:RNA-binding protein 43 n=1 Tax=Petaurus breviceps papuanus TaxID=3040969 RepID=UPI0036DCA00E
MGSSLQRAGSQWFSPNSDSLLSLNQAPPKPQQTAPPVLRWALVRASCSGRRGWGFGAATHPQCTSFCGCWEERGGVNRVRSSLLLSFQPHYAIGRKTKLKPSQLSASGAGFFVESAAFSHRQASQAMASLQNVKEPEAYERTIVVSNIPVGNYNDEAMADILKNYFQKVNDKDGEVENVTYPTKVEGVAFVTFKEIKGVENVLKKKKHSLTLEGQLPTCLTVSHFSENVIRCIFVHLDLSIFGKEVILENLVTELKEKIPSLKFYLVEPNGRVIVKGSFLAIKKLKEFLLLRASSLHGNNTNCVDLRNRKKKEISSEWSSSTSSGQPKATGNEQIIVLDTDVFKYMKLGNQMYEKILKDFNVLSQEIVNDEVTTICLRAAQADSHSDHLKKVKELIEEFSYTLSLELRKETISLEGKAMNESNQIVLACEVLKPQYPQILIECNSKHIDIIGNASDTYQFKKLVLKAAGKKGNFRNHNDSS